MNLIKEKIVHIMKTFLDGTTLTKEGGIGVNYFYKILIITLIFAAFFCGWKVASWHYDSLLYSQKVNEETLQRLADNISKDASLSLEKKLEDLKNVAPTKTIYKELVKPVFTNICVSDDFVRMYNKSIEDSERVLSGKPKDEVQNGKSSKIK